MADERTFIRLHDGMPDHPKIEGLSDRAFRLLVSTWCWCSRQLTDGKVPAKVWTKRGTPAGRRELMDAGLAVDCGEYIEMHDYLEHQRSAAEVAELRAQRAEAGRKGGLAKARKVASAKASATTLAKQTRSKTVPSTETDSSEPKGSGRPEPPAPTTDTSAQPLVGEWLEHCAERPPGRVVGQVAREVKTMLDEGIAENRIREGLAVWHRKALHPSALASVVHEVSQRTPVTVPDDPDALPPPEQSWMRRRPS